jgi:hypothetical protein
MCINRKMQEDYLDGPLGCELKMPHSIATSNTRYGTLNIHHNNSLLTKIFSKAHWCKYTEYMPLHRITEDLIEGRASLE